MRHFTVLLHLLRKRVDGIAQNGGVDIPVDGLVGRVVRRFWEVAGIGDVPVGPAAAVGGVEVDHYPAHPAEKGRLLQIVVNAGDNRGKGAVHELVGVRQIRAKPPRHGKQPRPVFAFQPLGASLAVLSQFFNDVHL